eukprot:1181919-Prorocentrum_minimum.AAC.1
MLPKQVKFLQPKSARATLQNHADLAKLEQSVGGDMTYEFNFQVRVSAEGKGRGGLRIPSPQPNK